MRGKYRRPKLKTYMQSEQYRYYIIGYVHILHKWLEAKIVCFFFLKSIFNSQYIYHITKKKKGNRKNVCQIKLSRTGGGPNTKEIYFIFLGQQCLIYFRK